MSGKVLVLAANGNVGAKVVAGLLAKGEKVRAASRSGKAPSGAEGVVFDYADPATFAPAFEGVDRAFFILSAGVMTTVETLKPLIEIAAARKVKVVLMTAFGVDADDSIPYRQAEILLEKSGTPYVIVRPNWFTDNFVTYWGEGIKHGVIAVPAGEGKSAFIDTRDIADSVVAALTTSAHDGKSFNLTGPDALSYGEAAALISKATGKEVNYIAVTDDAFVSQLVGFGVPEAYARFLAAIFYPVREGWTAAVTPAVQTLTGKAPRSVAAWVAENAAVLKG